VRWLLAPLVLTLLTQAALAQESDDNRRQRFNDNIFAAGSEVRVTESGLKDVFAAGETVTVDSDVRETAHAAGRQVRVNRPVGQNVYAFGYDVDIEAPVGADVIAAGFRVAIGPNASVAGDVIAAGRTIAIRGPVMGGASLTGGTVEIAAPISGSVQIRAREIRFAEGARIDGTLSYTSLTPVTVPAGVILRSVSPRRFRATKCRVRAGSHSASPSWLSCSGWSRCSRSWRVMDWHEHAQRSWRGRGVISCSASSRSPRCSVRSSCLPCR
jgi:cytoskeletal protein CcmA (bactofilin family)